MAKASTSLGRALSGRTGASLSTALTGGLVIRRCTSSTWAVCLHSSCSHALRLTLTKSRSHRFNLGPRFQARLPRSTSPCLVSTSSCRLVEKSTLCCHFKNAFLQVISTTGTSICSTITFLKSHLRHCRNLPCFVTVFFYTQYIVFTIGMP